MTHFVAVTLILLMSAGMVYGSVVSVEEIDKKVERFGLFRMLDECVFVAVGRVELLQGVYRKHLHYDEYFRSWSSAMCTDVYFRIQYLVKGEANLGKKYRRFMYEGGTGYDSDNDEVYSMSISTERGYEVGDRLFLFLTNKEDSTGYYAGWPYDKCRVYFGSYEGQYGDQELKGEHPKVWFTYPRKNGRRHKYRIPYQLAVNLGRAYMKDKELAIPLENMIKERALHASRGEYDLPQDLLVELNDRALDIIAGREQKRIWMGKDEPE